MISASFPDPRTVQLSPSNVSISAYPTPESIEEALALSTGAPRTPPDPEYTSRPAMNRSQSSNWFMEIRKSAASRSRKISHTTIQTDATETQPAFESDRFAVDMPTTREPVMEVPVFRAKLPSPSKAQAEAFQTYKRKGQQAKERNQLDGVRVPSKIVSYDAYAAQKHTGHRTSEAADMLNHVSSPQPLPLAGSFPISPPIPQSSWTQAEKRPHLRPTRSVSDSGNISIPRKPIGHANLRSAERIQYHHDEVGTGATRATRSPSPRATPTPSPSKIKLRFRPKASDADRPQKESWAGLYRSPQSSADASRDTSPTKTHFADTTTGADVFKHTSDDITAASAAAGVAKTKAKSTPKKTPQKRTLASRWAWLRSAGPRVNKPTATHTIPTSVPAKAATYIDPFVRHATPVPPIHSITPTVSRPASPKKLVRAAALPKPKDNFKSGFAQLKSLCLLIVKLCLLVYVLVGLYFLLDAIREAVNTLTAPFRGVGMIVGCIWAGIAWVARLLGRVWDTLGFRITFSGG
ncbi:hypothetical protein BDV95DRAFT_590135 [Massariosphaeria phaeospora]|uniref:Uncharacterized protein n=1 Tax=Massariosphaeria phaeospora TaxID=100035 RepID=A0A7C8MG19_9PLEO|nr:hypothetical protein BDV95DRAFT_590135 [Massariosphaeria phaeospora]